MAFCPLDSVCTQTTLNVSLDYRIKWSRILECGILLNLSYLESLSSALKILNDATRLHLWALDNSRSWSSDSSQQFTHDLSQFTYISSHNNLTGLLLMTPFPLFFFPRISLHPSSLLWISSLPHFSISRITKIHEQIKLFPRYIWNRTSILSAAWHSLEFPIVSFYARDLIYDSQILAWNSSPFNNFVFDLSTEAYASPPRTYSLK